MENKNQNNLIGENKLREVLKDELKDFATKDDIESIREDQKDFATKDDLGNEIAKVHYSLDTKIDKVHDKLDKKIDDKFNDVLNQGDLQIKLLTEIQQEVTMHSKSYKDNKEETKKHKKILNTIEERLGVLELQPAM